MKRIFAAAAVAAGLSWALPFAAGAHELGFPGLLTGLQRLEPITLSAGKPLAEKPYELESGRYYRLEIIADGSQELGVVGPEFFRNIWINEVVINDIEVRPLGLDGLEFDDAGSAEISFVTIRPGTFILRIPGTTGETQQAIFNVK
jgi:hypothetical protein